MVLPLSSSSDFDHCAGGESADELKRNAGLVTGSEGIPASHAHVVIPGNEVVVVGVYAGVDVRFRKRHAVLFVELSLGHVLHHERGKAAGIDRGPADFGILGSSCSRHHLYETRGGET